MKKLLFLVTLCSLILAMQCQAVDFKADLAVKTGDAALDLHLRNVNEKASTPAGANEIKNDLRQNLSLSDREISFLSRKGYTLAEINYLALLAKQSGKSVNDVAALHSKGVGWGVLAKRLGVRPSDLNKLRVQKKKREKAVVKEQTREQIKLKIQAPETMRIKETPRMEKGFGPAGGGRGMGRGRGR